jgi:hypothetical protein
MSSVLNKHLDLGGGYKSGVSRQVERVVARHPESIDQVGCVRAVDVNDQQLGGPVRDLCVLRKQQAIQPLLESFGKARGHIEQDAVLKIENAHVRDHPPLRRQVGRITHAANWHCHNVIGEKTLQP